MDENKMFQTMQMQLNSNNAITIKTISDKVEILLGMVDSLEEEFVKHCKDDDDDDTGTNMFEKKTVKLSGIGRFKI